MDETHQIKFFNIISILEGDHSWEGVKPVFTAKPGQMYSYKCLRKHQDLTQPQRAARDLTQP